MRPERKISLPALEELLTSGGDTRIIHNGQGMNKYGCFSVPQQEILAYGSSTASTISPAGFAAATRLYHRLETAPISYAHEMERIRGELIALCALPGCDIIFGASGTDIHLFAAQLLRASDASLLVIMPDASETGSGVPSALQGRHFSSRTALGGAVTMDKAIDSLYTIETAAIKSRMDNGALRPASLVDAEVEALVMHAAREGRRILLILTDLSKTGQAIPSRACAFALKTRFPAQVDILVDACQFRLSQSTLRDYLEQDAMLAVTGSKFVTGPAFSAALLVPQPLAQRLRPYPLPPALALYSARADWPASWAARANLPDTANYGLLLRWEAALAELRAFHALPETSIRAFIENFAQAVQKRMADDPAFVLLASEIIDHQPLASVVTWDQLPTIFPFHMRHPDSGNLLPKDVMTNIYELMRQDLGHHSAIPAAKQKLAATRCYLGQPVACGALRLCLDMRLIADALAPEGRGSDAVIAGAMRVLDKAALLAGCLPKLS